MGANASAIPYEAQSNSHTNRSCGAACLAMVYRSLGMEISQAEIWPAIARRNRFGSIASTTHLMTKDALRRGFQAVAIQAKHPLQALRCCREKGFRAILNHRLNNDAPTGHYSVLVDIDSENVLLHDPFLGPSRSLPHSELLELWQPRGQNSEIAGNMLIAVASESDMQTACEICRAEIPPHTECPRCKQPVSLQPPTLLGCLNDACVGRMWRYITCPGCDYTWTFNGQLSDSGISSLRTSDDPLNLTRIFAELDKFCSRALSFPGAAENADIRKQVAHLEILKERLRLSQAEEVAFGKIRRANLASFVDAARQKAEAHKVRMEELNKPSPPLDGNALGRALLTSLGLAG